MASIVRSPGQLLLAALAAAVAAAVVVLAVTALGGSGPGHVGSPPANATGAPGARSSATSTAPASGSPSASGRPNIVFVLTDDLSMDLLRFMPEVQALQQRGMTFDNYFVSDSLCCPSRSSIFTGDFPHDTGVFTNTGPHGGIGAFYDHDDENHTFNLALQRAGYRTAMMGKYLNGYLEGPQRSPVPSTYVPPGWSQWDVAGWGYPEFNYRLNENGTLHYFGHAPRDYLTDVITRRGVSFIDSSARSGRPFFLELATFAPHTPYVPAPRDAHAFPGLQAPRPPSFDVLPLNAPPWLADRPPLTDEQLARIDRAFRRRAQDVLSVDRMISRVELALQRHNLLSNTYIVFSSDNGLHTGEYRLLPGKLTAFDTDIHVPLVVAGPGVPPGASTDAMTENVDLADTFAQMGGTSMSTDGHSLMPLLSGAPPEGWRNAILVEHRHPIGTSADPDEQGPPSGNPPSYEAMRTKRYLYVEYDDGGREFYDLQNDPYELDNLAPSLSPDQLDQLHAELLDLQQCHGAVSCWAAEHVADLANAANTRR